MNVIERKATSMYTIIKTIRREYQTSTEDMYELTLGPFADRRLAEQTMAQVAALESTATVRIAETDCQ
jgi:phage gp37-like protein